MSEAVEYAEALQKAAEAQSRVLASKAMMRRIFSELVIQYNEGSTIERQHKARAHPKYIEAENTYLSDASNANILGAKADAAKIKWETWRSEHATARVLR